MTQFSNKMKTDQKAQADQPPIQPEVTIRIEFYCPLHLVQRLDNHRGEQSRSDALRELLETYLL